MQDLAIRPEAAEPTHDAVVTEVLEVLLENDELGRPTQREALDDRLPLPPRAIDEAVASLVAASDVSRDDHDRLVLTDTGRGRAVRVVRRHRLTERLLSDVLHLEWWKVHHEAGRWERALTDETEQHLVELLDDPGTCPHGNPIPGSSNRPHHPDAVLLGEAPQGPVRVVRITETLEGDDEALQLLQACGFVPGRDAEVKQHADGWVEVAGTVRDAALPPHVAAHTYVEPR